METMPPSLGRGIKEVKTMPPSLSEDDIEAASAGRSEDVSGEREPLQMTEDEIRAASEGRSEEVIAGKQPEGS